MDKVGWILKNKNLTLDFTLIKIGKEKGDGYTCILISLYLNESI